MTVRIRSLQESFRRCGIAHGTKIVEYPDKKFSPEDLKILKAEPMLVVEVLTKADLANEKTEAKKETVLEEKEAELKQQEAALEQKEAEIEKAAKKEPPDKK